MIRPPLLMRLSIRNPESKIRLWLPLFLLIPVIIVAFIILLPFILIASIVLWPTGWGKTALLMIPTAWVALCSLRGLEVNVQNTCRNEHVFISVV